MKKGLVFLILFVHFISIIFGQSFNMVKKAQVGGLPGAAGNAFGYSAVFGCTDASGNEYAIIGSAAAVNIFNVNNCSSPTLLLSHQDGFSTTWREFASYQNYVYAICDGSCQSGLQIFNINTLAVTSQTTNFTKGHTIFVDPEEARLYVMGSGNRLLIFTLDTEIVGGVTYLGTPAVPVLIRDFPTVYIHDMFVRNNIGYASVGYTGFILWDLTNPANIPQLASTEPTSGYNHSSWIHSNGSHTYVTEEVTRGLPMKIFQKTGTGVGTAINYLGSFKEPLEAPTAINNRAHNPHIKDNLMFVSYYEDGVQVFDVSNPTSPKRIAYYDTYLTNNGSGYPCDGCWGGCWGVYPFLASGCILASDLTGGLFTLAMDMPTSDGTNVGTIMKVENADIQFSSNTKGIVLRSDKGYCFRIKVAANGSLTTERIVCHVNNAAANRVYKGDVALPNPVFGVVLKDQDNMCKKINIVNGAITLTDASCNPNTPPIANIQNSDLIVETYTKGLILKDSAPGKFLCYRITVNNDGVLTALELNSCP